jgi:hypothetical protein
VRLDHLLSKEHLAPACRVRRPGPRLRRTPGEWCSRVEHRLWPSRPLSRCLYSRFAGSERAGWGCGGLTRCWVLRERAEARTPSGRRRDCGPGSVAGRLRSGGPPHGCGAGTDRWRRSRPSLENCTVDASIFSICGQVFKGTRWMPWHQEPKKDVGACDKPRGVGNRTLIRGSPNGETRLESCPVTRT